MWGDHTAGCGFWSSLPGVGERQRVGTPAALTLSCILSHQGQGRRIKEKAEQFRCLSLVFAGNARRASPSSCRSLPGQRQEIRGLDTAYRPAVGLQVVTVLYTLRFHAPALPSKGEGQDRTCQNPDLGVPFISEVPLVLLCWAAGPFSYSKVVALTGECFRRGDRHG